MRILVIGGGGREHALAWKLAQEHDVFAQPGNPGISQVAECLSGDPVDVATTIQADLVVVGPENPLIDGIADRLRSAGFPVVGPGASGSRLEASKAFSKDLMASAGVPTAQYRVFHDAHEAKSYAMERFSHGFGVAVKASGAALGKGVVVCGSFLEAEEAIGRMLVDREFGASGDEVVIEDRLTGTEFSLLTLCSGTSFTSLPVAQDYKRALDGDRGPNTGGMGTYSPVSWLSESLVEEAERTIVEPMLQELERRGIEYRGVLFSGIMVQAGEPMCLEYNVRFGDPETQSVMRRIGGGFGEALFAVATGGGIPAIETLENHAVTVVMASGGYPGDYEKGVPINIEAGLSDTAVVFHAGTALREGQLVTAGGRVLAISEVGASLPEAREKAYSAVEKVGFAGMTFRRDIGA